MNNSKRILEHFGFNYYIVLIFIIFMFNIFFIGDFGYIHIFFIALSFLFLIGSILQMWCMKIYSNGIFIQYFISLGRNKKLKWIDIKNIEVFFQIYRGIKFKELSITPYEGKKIKFFRIGVRNYSKLCDKLTEIYKAEKSSAGS